MEILQDTIIQTLFRQGPNTDRTNIVLKSGEPGYTTDTKRLFVGDGVTPGGINIGNLYKGEFLSNDPSTLFSPVPGDFAFNEERKEMCVLKNTDYTNLTSWKTVGKIPGQSLEPNAYIYYHGIADTVNFSHNCSASKIGTGEYEINTSTIIPTLYIPVVTMITTGVPVIYDIYQNTSTQFVLRIFNLNGDPEDSDFIFLLLS